MLNRSQSQTRLMEFASLRPFRIRQPLSAAEQVGDAGQMFLTSSEPFANGVVLRDPAGFRVERPQLNIPCLPRDAWAATDYRGKSVLFLLPGEALGEAAATYLFLLSFMRHSGARAVGVFCARSCTDIYAREPRLKVFPIWIERRELRRWQIVVDLGQLETRRTIDTWPVDMEGELLAAFGGLPSAADRCPDDGAPRPDRAARPRIGIFPIASSPLRTLPPPLGLRVAETLAGLGDLTVVLNTDQRQGRLFAEAIRDRLPPGVKTIGTLPTMAGLMQAIAGFDYAVFADSGPAHLSKLTGTHGLAIYSSAPGDLLQGRFTNLARFQLAFEGPHCRAPCGLAKLRKSDDGRVGCMGSLGLPLDRLPGVAGRSDAGEIDRLQREPVPCLASLVAQPGALLDALATDARRRLW